MADQRFRYSKELRVRRQADFDLVYRRNVYSADATLVVQGCENGLSRSRLGLSVSRRVGNAVVRNRWKRMIREAFRQCRHQFPAGLDLVVRPRRGAQPCQADVIHSLPKLARRVHGQLMGRMR